MGVGAAVALGVGDGSAPSIVGAAVALGVGAAVALGVGAAVALGVGDGSAPSVVGAAVARSEAGPSVGSSEPRQASSSNRRISARAKTPRKRRGVLISLHSLRSLGPRWDGATRLNDNTNTWWGMACIASDTRQVAGDGISEALRAGLGSSPFFFTATWPVASSSRLAPAMRLCSLYCRDRPGRDGVSRTGVAYCPGSGVPDNPGSGHWPPSPPSRRS